MDYAKCICDFCGNHIDFPLEKSGTFVPCPHCGNDSRLVPDSSFPMVHTCQCGAVIPFPVGRRDLLVSCVQCRSSTVLARTPRRPRLVSKFWFVVAATLAWLLWTDPAPGWLFLFVCATVLTFARPLRVGFLEGLMSTSSPQPQPKPLKIVLLRAPVDDAGMAVCKCCRRRLAPSATTCVHCGQSWPTVLSPCPNCKIDDFEVLTKSDNSFALVTPSIGGIIASGLWEALRHPDTHRYRCARCGFSANFDR